MGFRTSVGLRLLLVVVAFCFSTLTPAFAGGKFAAITVDARTGSVLFSDDPDGRRHPASLTKMMTLYILFQELKAGRVKMSTPLRVSTRASRMSPSKLGLKAGTTITVEQAIKALIVKSANDVAATVGENLGSTESAFALRMTRVARSLGMTRTVYMNASGLPNASQVTTARDQATLSLRIMRDFPQYYPYFRLQGFTYKGRTIRSHNRLVGRFPGADGLKTGYVNASGYNLATSAKRGDKRLVGVVLGGKSAGRRNQYMINMLTKQFAKAKDGRTIAALAGSSAGAIDPLAGQQVALLSPPPAAPANIETPDRVKQMAQQELAELASNEPVEPKVLEARIDDQPGELPFAVKAATEETIEASEEELGSTDPVEDWVIQIGVYNSQKSARARLQQVGKKLPDLLTGKPASAVAVRAGTKKHYRARFTGFDEDGAQEACMQLMSMQITCLPVSPQS